jgi:UDP:flavonoid glycosyltransferase YjiC (YdhE family)
MTKSKSGRTILCTWEMGGELGHLAQLALLTKALESDGHRVVLALKDLSRCYPFFKETEAQILQAPNWLLQLKMQRPIACQADALLLSGYVDADALFMLTKAWKSIVQLVKPDVVIFDYSPTAQLALHDETGIRKIIQGTGFSVPEAGYPIADWRYQIVSDNLVEEQERVALNPINMVLKKLNKPVLEKLSDLWKVDQMILCEYPPFDLYHKSRTNTEYCIKKDSSNNQEPIVFPDTGRKKIIAYFKPAHPGIEQLIKALALTNADVFVVCLMGPEKVLKSCESDHFKYSTTPVNLTQGFTQADLFIGHGNSNTVTEALGAGIPVIAFPLQQEQLLIAKTLQEFKVGLLMLDFDDIEMLAKQINTALDDKALLNHAKGFSQKFKQHKHSVVSAVRKCMKEFFFDK